MNKEIWRVKGAPSRKPQVVLHDVHTRFTTVQQILFAATVGVVVLLLSSKNSAGQSKTAASSWKNHIIHDAEHFILQSQHREKWAQEDNQVEAKLAESKQKFGTPPNIIHILWDDTHLGEVGIPAIQKVRGFETPNINRLAAEGINFMRMYSEPSCTQSRAALMTGRLPVRNGMTRVGMPYEYGGLPSSEVTIADVLSHAGYTTGFFGKWHLGDIESSYANKRGFDESLWMAELYEPFVSCVVWPSAVVVVLTDTEFVDCVAAVIRSCVITVDSRVVWFGSCSPR